MMDTNHSANTENAIISPVKLAHFVVRTSNFKEIVDWYLKVLGAEISYANDQLAFMTYDDEHHRVAVLNIPGLGKQPDGIVGIHHVAFTYATLNDLMSTYERLKKMDIKPVYVINHGPTTSLYYADPDGNQLEFQIDNYDTVEEAGKFFFSKEFAENPIGVEFDPDELLARLRAGEPESELKKRPNVGSKDLSDVKLK
ncbi:MAG: VOC family protein [Porticoccaceae bacterium]|nr:VOC family protein [Porticoccaceae bacterium]